MIGNSGSAWASTTDWRGKNGKRCDEAAVVGVRATQLLGVLARGACGGDAGMLGTDLPADCSPGRQCGWRNLAAQFGGTGVRLAEARHRGATTPA